MTRVNRFDSGSLTKAKRTPQGYLRAPAFATRTGVFSYMENDGKVRRELRHPDDVFHADSMATLAGVPVTDDHPFFKDRKTMLIDAENTRDFMVGYTGDSVTADGIYLATTLTITDSKMIAAVEGGVQELSCGYTCDREDTQGEYEGQPYDCRQRNITYNHLAITPKGRAGPDVRLRLDAADAVQVEESTIDKEKRMKVTLGGTTTIEVTEGDAALLKAHLDSLTAAAGTEKARADSAEGKADALKADLAKKEAELTARTDAADPANVRKLARELNRVETVARKILSAEVVAKLDSMDEQAIKVAVIKADVKDVNLDGKSAGYIDARFDAIAERNDKNGQRLDAVGAAIVQVRQDGAKDVPDAEAARKRQREESLNAWRAEKAN